MLPVVKTLTPVGRVVFAVMPLALVIGVLTGWNEFFVLGVACLFALSVGAAWISRPQTLGVERSLHPPKVTVGESAVGVLSVTNDARRRSGQRIVEDQLGPDVVRIALPSLAPKASVEFPYQVPAPKRGLFAVGPLRVVRTDPLGLFRLEQGQGNVEMLWVRPRVFRLANVSSGWAKDLDGATSDRAPRGSAAFHALREYQYGDDLRHVHWRTTARTGELMVRQYVDTRRSMEVVMLDPRAELYSDETFEMAIEIVGSVCVAAALDNRPSTLVLPGQSDTAQSELIEPLDRLAVASTVSEASLSDHFALARKPASQATALIVVTGDTDPQDLITNAKRILRSGLVVIVRIVAGSRPSLVPVGGARVITTPDTDSLRSVWAEAVMRA